MNKFLISFVTLVGLSGCNQSLPVKPSSFNGMDKEIRNAEQDGLALFKAMNSTDATDGPTSREADLLDMASDKLLCEEGYKAVRVNDYDDNLEHIYLVLEPARDKGIQFGRHVKFSFILGTNDLNSITPSTKTCLLVPVEADSTDAAFVTHLLSKTPTDFHVYLSLYHQASLYVGTSEGTWVVDKGKISMVERGK